MSALIKKILFSFLLIVTVASCGKKEDAANTNTGSPNVPTAQNSSTQSIEGEWVISCATPNASTATTSATFTFAQKTWSIEMSIFTDKSCAKKSMVLSVDGDYFMKGQAASPEGATNIDIKFGTYKIKLLDEDYVKTYNDSKICNATDWKVGVEKSCTPPSTASYNIYKIIDGKLVFGDTNGTIKGETPEKRPISFDNATVYTKQ